MTRGELDGLAVLVTGAASGIGRATVDLLASRGASVVALDPQLEHDPGTGPVIAVRGDAASEADVGQSVGAALDRWGHLDAVVCGAGVGTFGTVLEAEDVWHETLRGNLESARVTVRGAMPELIRARGAIVIVSSLAGTVAVPGSVAYTTSKHALIGLTRSLAADFGALGVRANVVCPGAVRTPMLDRVMDEIGGKVGLDRSCAYERAAALTPLRRAAEPAEIAEIIAFLASPRSSIITGAVLMADGGVSAVDLSLSGLTMQLPDPGPRL